MQKVVPNSSEKSNGNTSRLFEKKQISPAKWWSFTLNNYNSSNIDDLLNTLNEHKYVFQEETGEQGTPHLQGCVEFKEKLRPLSLNLPKEMHWTKTRNGKASIKYCCKEETRSGEIFTNIKLSKPIKVLKEDNLYDWQKEVIEMIKEEPDDRKCYWYWENKGNRGKSALIKLLCYKYGAIVLSNKASDMKYGIVKYIEKHGAYPEIILIDIPRTSLDYLSYTGLEEVKNGCFFSSKYECEMVIGNSPHLIIFANEGPNITKMSEDRWVIKEI